VRRQARYTLDGKEGLNKLERPTEGVSSNRLERKENRKEEKERKVLSMDVVLSKI